MRKKKSLFIITAAFCSLLAVGTLSLSLISKGRFLAANSDNDPYVLNLNRNITASEISAG